MIPSFVILPGAQWPVLPPGIYDASWDELLVHFSGTKKRQDLFEGMKRALSNLFNSGSPQIFLDGSFVTAKPNPGDYEIVWDPRFVDPNLLDPIFLDFSNGTINQKLKYYGEFFPSIAIEARSGNTFLEFFQKDKDTGRQKGIIRVQNYLKTGSII
jgi:hypothetical protein